MSIGCKSIRQSPRGWRAARIVPLILAMAGSSLAVWSTAAHAQDPQGADAQVVDRVKSALNSSAGVDAKHIEVTVDKGDVVLSGFVQSSHAVVDAQRLAVKAAGGRKVVDHLSVQQNYPNAP